jgi:hypothetical protein
MYQIVYFRYVASTLLVIFILSKIDAYNSSHKSLLYFEVSPTSISAIWILWFSYLLAICITYPSHDKYSIEGQEKRKREVLLCE